MNARRPRSFGWLGLAALVLVVAAFRLGLAQAFHSESTANTVLVAGVAALVILTAIRWFKRPR